MNTPLHNDLLMVLQSVGMGDLETAREFAGSYCQSQASILPDGFAEWMSACLYKPSFLPVPPELNHLVICEDVSATFNPRRYWVSEREDTLIDEIISLHNAVQQVQQAKIPFGNSTLLSGPPGVGKTCFARCLAYTLQLPLIYIDLCQIVGAQYGSTAHNLQAIFQFASKTPCVFLLDELDGIAGNRGTISNGGSGDEVTRTTLALMQCMDRLPEKVILLATTNRPDIVDKGVIRRFTIRHEFKHFSPDELVAMIVAYLQDVREEGELDLKWDENDIRTQCGINTSQSDLINYCNRAILKAVREDGFVRFEAENKGQQNKSHRYRY